MSHGSDSQSRVCETMRKVVMRIEDGEMGEGGAVHDRRLKIRSRDRWEVWKDAMQQPPMPEVGMAVAE